MAPLAPEIPTTIFKLVITRAASTEFPATARFSRRIETELKAARISGINVIIALDSPAANPLTANGGPLPGLPWDMLR